MSSRSKKITVLLLTILISLNLLPINASAMISPFVTVLLSMSTDAGPDNEVNGGDEINVVVTWKGVYHGNGERLIIQVTNGAEILINSGADVIFDANGQQLPVNSVTRSPAGDVVTVITGPAAQTPADNYFYFTIKAPSSTVNFDLSVTTGYPVSLNPRNFVQQEFTVKP